MLANIDGFVSIERFASLQTPDKVLSLSFWRDEQAIEQWRNLEQHRLGQAEGLRYIFDNYQIRVGQIIRDYSPTNRSEAPDDSNSYHQG